MLDFCSRLQSTMCMCYLIQFSACVALLYGHFDIAVDACALPKLVKNPMWLCGKGLVYFYKWLVACWSYDFIYGCKPATFRYVLSPQEHWEVKIVFWGSSCSCLSFFRFLPSALDQCQREYWTVWISALICALWLFLNSAHGLCKDVIQPWIFLLGVYLRSPKTFFWNAI